MSPKFLTLIGRNALMKRLYASFAAALLFSYVVAAKAETTTNFAGDFQAAFWTAQPQSGAIFFTNADTELVIAGPDKPPSETTSLDAITYKGPAAGGLVTEGFVSFDWHYDSPFGIGDQAYFMWNAPDGRSRQFVLAANNGSGGNSLQAHLDQGWTFEFGLITHTPANETGAIFTINNFQFQPLDNNTPEPSTGALCASALVLFVGARRWRRR